MDNKYTNLETALSTLSILQRDNLSGQELVLKSKAIKYIENIFDTKVETTQENNEGEK